jgi:hypothetical protein
VTPRYVPKNERDHGELRAELEGRKLVTSTLDDNFAQDLDARQVRVRERPHYGPTSRYSYFRDLITVQLANERRLKARDGPWPARARPRRPSRPPGQSGLRRRRGVAQAARERRAA